MIWVQKYNYFLHLCHTRRGFCIFGVFSYFIIKVMTKKKIVALTGAGISAESGFSTFRGAGGLWGRYPVEQVATPEGWAADPDLVTDFYNGLRSQLDEAVPNAGHRILAELEKDFDVTVVTQNVDDLHERAGSTNVIHLHGELRDVCSSAAPNDARYRRRLAPGEVVKHGQLSGDGSLERPFIVWFGEAVPMLEVAAEAAARADVFLIVGTSLNVYPAAGLIGYVPAGAEVMLVDPNPVRVPSTRRVEVIAEPASRGMEVVRERLRAVMG